MATLKTIPKPNSFTTFFANDGVRATDMFVQTPTGTDPRDMPDSNLLHGIQGTELTVGGVATPDNAGSI